MGAWSQDTSAALGRVSLLVAYCSNLDLGRTVHLHIGDITPNAAPGSCDPALKSLPINLIQPFLPIKILLGRPLYKSEHLTFRPVLSKGYFK